MTVVETAAQELLVGLDESAESDPAKEQRKVTALNMLLLTLIGSVQVGAWALFAYATYLFVFS